MDSKLSRTLGRVALHEEEDSRRSHVLVKVTLGTQIDPSQTDYGEAYLELAPSGRASTRCTKSAEAEIAKASKVYG